MKNFRLVLVLAAALCGSTMNVPAHGCGWGFSIGIPFVSFGLGFGVGTACGLPGYYCGYPSYGYPGYVYTQPAYVYSSTAPASASPVVASAAQPAPQETVWVPSTPGAGHWVPDPQPYSYTPGQQTTASANTAPSAKPTTVTVNLSRSAGGVPIYIVTAR